MKIVIEKKGAAYYVTRRDIGLSPCFLCRPKWLNGEFAWGSGPEEPHGFPTEVEALLVTAEHQRKLRECDAKITPKERASYKARAIAYCLDKGSPF